MKQSTLSRTARKPQKPRRDFPLFAHQNGRWAKKVRGKLCYFGKWSDDPDGEAALKLWSDQKDELLAGKPQPKITHKAEAGVPLHRLVNEFLNTKRRLLDAGEITARTFGEYHSTGVKLVDVLGRNRDVESLTPEDFGGLREELAKTRKNVGLANTINVCRMFFKFGWDNGLLTKPVRYGQSFNRPSAKVLRLARAANASRMIEAADLRRVIDAADHPLRAMILLGANCGFGATDVASLPQSAVDLKRGWITFPRPKTGIARRCPLWPETVAALNDAIAIRPAAKDAADDGLVFINVRGRRWLQQNESDDPANWNTRTDLIGRAFDRLLRELELKRPGAAFYSLRHVFRTIADEARDTPATDLIMGHTPASGDMGAQYREYIADERLAAVTAHERRWRFGKGRKGGAR